MELSRPPLVVTFELSEKRKAIVAHALAGASAVVYLTELEEAARAEALRNTGALLTFNTSKELRSGEARVLNLSRPDLMRRASYKNIAKGLRRLERASSRRTQQDERPNSRTTRRSRGADRSGRACNRADTSTNCR